MNDDRERVTLEVVEEVLDRYLADWFRVELIGEIRKAAKLEVGHDDDV